MDGKWNSTPGDQKMEFDTRRQEKMKFDTQRQRKMECNTQRKRKKQTTRAFSMPHSYDTRFANNIEQCICMFYTINESCII